MPIGEDLAGHGAPWTESTVLSNSTVTVPRYIL
jgi:hypothetical protein